MNTKQQASALPVEFHDYKESVMRVAGILWFPTMRSRDILLQAKGDHLGHIHSYQMVLKMIKQGRLVPKSRSSAEAKSLETSVKGTVQLLLQWDSSWGGHTRGQGAELKGYSHREPTQEGPPGLSPLRSDGYLGGQAGGRSIGA
jgi:hypothetical protein